MKYEAKEITNKFHYWIVVDENDVQVGEDYLHPLHAQWAAEDLNKGKKKLTLDESFDLAFGITGEVEEHRETGSAISVPATAEKIVPVEESRDYTTIPEQNEVGAIIEYRGESWLVTQAYEVTGYEHTHDEDEAPEPGWYSQLFRVRDNHQAMQVVAEQARAGQAHFTGPFTVKLADEPLPIDMRKLAYSPQSGLHVRA